MNSIAADQDTTTSLAEQHALQRVLDRLARQFPDLPPEELERAVQGESLRLVANTSRGREPANGTCPEPTDAVGRSRHRA
jgi:hypothetical protein